MTSGVRGGEQTQWTPERLETLQRLYAEGLSYTDIATAIGDGATRNAVCGKISRLGVKRPPAVNLANKTLNGQRNIIIAKVEQMRQQAEKPKPPKAPPVKRRIDSRGGGVKATQAAQAVARAILAPAPPTEARTELSPLVASLVDLQSHHCRWPIGDHDFAFCGRPRLEGRPYCEHHLRRATSPIATRKWDSHGRRAA